MPTTLILSTLVSVFLPFFAFSAKADVPAESNIKPKVIAVQRRAYALVNELTLQASYLPIDSFNRYLAFGGSYTHFYTNYLGWEIINLEKALNSSTGLQSYLSQQYQASTEPFNTLDYFVSTNVVYTPFYTKNLFMNSNIFYGEVSFVAGPGMAKFDSGFANSFDLGLMLRFFLGHTSSLKFDFRNYIYLSGGLKTNLAMTVGYSFDFGGEPEKVEKVEVKEQED